MKRISSDLEIIAEVMDLTGARVLDVGCGLANLVRILEAQGARVIGLEALPMLGQVVAARHSGGSLLIVGEGQRLAVRTSAVDLVVFMASLHHIPGQQMAAALGEARRVLQPTGRLLVVEPVAEPGSYFELIRLVEDEREVQARAQAALADATSLGLERAHEWSVYFERSLDDYANLVSIYVGDDSERHRILDAAQQCTAELAASKQQTVEDFRYKSICHVAVLAPC